jgi:hypothetical protein
MKVNRGDSEGGNPFMKGLIQLIGLYLNLFLLDPVQKQSIPLKLKRVK